MWPLGAGCPPPLVTPGSPGPLGPRNHSIVTQCLRNTRGGNQAPRPEGRGAIFSKIHISGKSRAFREVSLVDE